MKTITIPDYKNPFIVVINNHVYRYKGGETIEVPDEVAEAIEDAIELEPKPKRYLSKLAQRVDGSITELTIGDLVGVETIAYYAFGQCSSLISAEIPDSVKDIGGSAFHGCHGLKSIKFGVNSRLKSIGTAAFAYCSRLEKVFLPVTPPTIADSNVFTNMNAKCTFYCKSQASLDAYKKATNWSTLTGTYSFVVEA